jgi:exosome complex component MTR3
MSRILQKDLALLIGPALETAVLLTRYPKSVIEIFLLVLEVEGDIASLAITCSSVALADAGIEMYDLVASCSTVKTDGGLVVDPSRGDLEQQTGYVLTALMPTRGEITALSQSGMWDGEVLEQGIDLTLEGARQIHVLMRQALCEGLAKELPEGTADAMVQ